MTFGLPAAKDSTGPGERQNSLDALRGAAAVSVVLIHTVYGSGVAYVPAWMRQLVLMFDVPVFFFLAGWTQALRPVSGKTLRGLSRLYVDYVIFSAVVLAACIAMGSNGPIDWIRMLILQGFRTRDVPIFGESMWFIKVYLFVSLAFYFVLSSIQHLSMADKRRSIACVLAFFAIIPVLVVFSQHVYVAFYASFWLMGWLYARYGFKKSAPWLVVGLWLAIGISFGREAIGTNFFGFSKFPPDAFYFFLSLPSIAICMLARSMGFRGAFLDWMGKNALWIYFAQGLSSSFIRYLVPENATDRWPSVLAMMFLVNLFAAIALSVLLRRAIEPVREFVLMRFESAWRFARGGFRSAS